MPPTLDLSRTTHSKMIISPPRINLRRATSYNHDKGPLSSTSSRFTFNHLVFSPPPSPGLPSLSPPLRKPSRGFTGFIRPRRLIRILLAISAIFCLFQGLKWVSENSPVLPTLSLAIEKYGKSDAVIDESLPKLPTLVIVTDKRRRPRWTVSIPQDYEFPLALSEYSSICAKCREMAHKQQQARSQDHSLQTAYLDFRSDSYDRDFIDVHDAQRKGLLPSPVVKNTEAGQASDLIKGGDTGVKAKKPQCSKSLTVVLESADAGIGSTLMMLWTAYGLAQKEGRAFFIDDTRWAYGSYSDIFRPAPSPKCAQPPIQEMIPCPRQARHLVATVASFSDIFPELTSGLSDPDQPLDISVQKSAFSFARMGHDALFHLNNDDGKYVDDRTRDLLSKRIVPKTKGKHNGAAIGIHIRRGDRHPFEYQYRDSYIPLNTYTEVARELIEVRFNHSGPLGGQDVAAKQYSLLVLASDDPTVFESSEVVTRTAGATYPAQDRIRLASKQAIHDVNPPDKSVMHKFVDETFGWEGGFFAPMFWNLGMGGAAKANENTNAVNMAKAAAASTLAETEKVTETGSEHPRSITPVPSAETIRLRSLVGRAYMMDLAVLADVSDAVICTVSAVGCRLLAVMMGWESAIEEGNWVNIDGSYGWLGVE